MSVFQLPVEVQREFLSLKRDAADPHALRHHLQHGWGPFHRLYVERLRRVRDGLARHGLEERLEHQLARILWVKAEVLFHVDFRCQAYRLLYEAHQMAPDDGDILGSLVRVELTHSKLRDAALHLFEAKQRGVLLPDEAALEGDLERAVADDLEDDLWERIDRAEVALEGRPGDAARWTDLAAEYFYEALDLEKGEECIARALEIGCEDPEAAFIGAEIAFEAGRTDLALERLEAMRKLAPRDSRAALLEVSVLCSLGRRRQALRVLQRHVGQPSKPLRMTCQDAFFQAGLNDQEEYHQTWLRLLRRLQVSTDGIGYYYSSGTPSGFFEKRLEAARVYHEARRLSLKYHHGDLAEEVEAGFRRLLAEAPEYTFLLDEAARFLLLAFPTGSPQVAEAGELAERAVYLSEIAGEPEDRFHATLAAARRAGGR